ncbi:MAG: acylphosphatase [Candidatus Marinimicrobia bacterium]|nr:acylphosphatase [Candidatus Neomarinimicrobiota bacterium]MBT3618568.1 acylphosphatase [Candidatus Neomarinimicrobiota bacterium]MBT3828795.1 acylphosphatase [Candidatus Neomarinimicrobiota bacterium]MBT3996843.1 acylphosphatase [Candidatus Neomarinimicrobiota bacterium]MBT4281006.1 acylphosphatase [Candidatus Neomarinimicrobiota bacterium]
MDFDIHKPENAGAKLGVSGKVQQVGFRWFTVQWAQDFRLAGYAKNLKDGTVLIEAEGKKMDIESLIKEVETGPRGADVDEVQVEWLPYEHRFRDFEIRR